MKKLLISLSVVILLLFYSCSTTGTGGSVVPESVNGYLDKNGSDFVNYELSDISPGVEYNFTPRSYNVYEDLETVWLDYLQTPPNLAFEGSIIDFGIVYNPEDSRVYNTQDTFIPSFSEGQVYILDLQFLGIYSIPVGFMVTRIDTEKKIMEFVYLKDNVSNGYQRIFFKAASDSEGNPVTLVEHLSYFRSGHDFRDKVLYPPFHKQTVDDFHEKIFELNGLGWKKL